MSEELSYEPSLGQRRVRVSFNPNSNTDVEAIKRTIASLIDFCENHKHKDPWLASLAQASLEEAAMWAVKLVTTEVKDQ